MFWGVDHDPEYYIGVCGLDGGLGWGGENQGKMRLTTLYNHFQPCYDHWCLQSVLC